MVTRCGSSSWVRHETGLILTGLILLFPFNTRSWASSSDDASIDTAALLQLEQRADAAQPRDQCYLFAEVLHGLTELESREVAAGDSQNASATLQRINTVAAKIQDASSSNAKRLKNAEMLFQNTTRRLTDMAHVASGAERAALQDTLKHLDSVHTKLLAMVFAK
jgi:hypothetical protein